MTYKPKHKPTPGLLPADRMRENRLLALHSCGLVSRIPADAIRSVRIQPGEITWYAPDTKFLEQYCVRTDV